RRRSVPTRRRGPAATRASSWRGPVRRAAGTWAPPRLQRARPYDCSASPAGGQFVEHGVVHVEVTAPDADLQVGLVGAVIVGAAGDDQAVAPGQVGDLQSLVGRVSAVDRLGAGQAETGQLAEGAVEVGGFEPQAQG